MKRILLAVALLAVLAVGFILYFVFVRLDTIVADAIQTYGSRIVGTSVRVGSVHLDLRQGRGTIRNLRVANPEGFSGDDAFRLDEIVLDLDPSTLTSRPIVIDELTVNGPRADFEVDARGRSNFQVLRSNVNAYTAGRGGEAAPQEEAGGEPVRLRIRRFVFEKGQVRADVRAVDPEREPWETELPAVRLQDVGGAGGGTPGQVGKTVLAAFTGQVVKTAAASQAQHAVEEKVGGETGKKAGELLRKVLE